MNVAFFEPYPHLYGGGQRTMHLLAGALQRRGVTVRVLVPGTGPLTERLAADGIAVEIVAMPGGVRTYGHRSAWPAAVAALPAAWAGLGRALRRRRPDVVHAANLRGILLAGPPARALRIPPVWHIHLGEDEPGLNRLAARLAARTVLPAGAATAGAVTIIPNAVPVEVFSDRPPAAERPTLVTCARLTPQKGIDVMLGAIPRLLASHPDLRVSVFGGVQAGYEGHADQLRRTIALRHLEGVVDLAGEVLDPWKRYRTASVYVQPSRLEIAPVAILEAMASGLPVVATSVGGVADMVVDGRTAILVPPEDPAALAAAVDGLLGDPERAATLGAAGARRAREHFGVDAMVDRWQTLYAELVG